MAGPRAAARRLRRGGARPRRYARRGSRVHGEGTAGDHLGGAGALLSQGEIEEDRGHLAAARERFDSVVESYPDSELVAEARLHLAEHRRAHDSHVAAFEDGRHGLDLNGGRGRVAGGTDACGDLGVKVKCVKIFQKIILWLIRFRVPAGIQLENIARASNKKSPGCIPGLTMMSFVSRNSG